MAGNYYVFNSPTKVNSMLSVNKPTHTTAVIIQPELRILVKIPSFAGILQENIHQSLKINHQCYARPVPDNEDAAPVFITCLRLREVTPGQRQSGAVPPPVPHPPPPLI